MILSHEKEYDIIYADPPWAYHDKSMNRGGAERHYSTMSIDDICKLKVPAKKPPLQKYAFSQQEVRFYLNDIVDQ